jgi:hypothetical protein
VVGTYDWNNFFTACGGTGPTCPTGEVTGDIVKSSAALPAGYITSSGKSDCVLPDNTLYTTGSKDTSGIGKWQCGQSGNSFGAKDDLSNAYQTAFRDPTSGHLIVFFGAEKKSGTGTTTSASGCSRTRRSTARPSHPSSPTRTGR